MRAAGAGIGGFFTPTGAGTKLAEGKETRIIDGKEYVFEKPLKGDAALIKADTADRWGNLTFRFAARNFAHHDGDGSGPDNCASAADR